MSTRAEIKEQERREALSNLRRILRPGVEVRTILRHVSSSGMCRWVSLVYVDKRGNTYDLDLWAAKVTGYAYDPKHNGLKVPGCGFDVGFDVVYSISRALYANKRGWACVGERCMSNTHVNDPRQPRGKGVRHHDAYALSQRWL